MMVGREVILKLDKKPAQPLDVVLDVNDLVVLDDRQLTAVNGVSFQVKAGEILGIAGVQGNGQTEVVEALTGLRSVKSGSIRMLDKNTVGKSPREITEIGSAHVPENRQRDGLVLSFSVADNLVLNTYYEPPFASGLKLHHDEIENAAKERVEQFDVRTPSVYIPASNLSGGNQQKVIVAREFSRPIKLLIASQPTRGLDVGSIEYIHSRILEKRDNGTAVLLISPELEEVMNLSDRIAVMCEGKIIGTVNAAEATKEKLGLLMCGITDETPEMAKA
jgi:simple sugar transport system ATP-binding protein